MSKTATLLRTILIVPRHWVPLAVGLALVLSAAWVFAHGPLHEQIDLLSLQIEAKPRDARLFLARGTLYRLDGNHARAAADYDVAVRLDASHYDVWACRAQLCRDAGRLSDALVAVDSFLIHEPDAGEVLLFRARILLDLGRSGEAIEVMDVAIANLVSPRPVHYIERARLIVKADPASSDRALSGLDDGIARLGHMASLQWCAIEICEQSGDYERALARMDEMTAASSRRDVLLARRGDILCAAGKPLEAMAAYTACLEAIESLPATARETEAVMELEHAVTGKLNAIEPTQTSAR